MACGYQAAAAHSLETLPFLPIALSWHLPFKPNTRNVKKSLFPEFPVCSIHLLRLSSLDNAVCSLRPTPRGGDGLQVCGAQHRAVPWTRVSVKSRSFSDGILLPDVNNEPTESLPQDCPVAHRDAGLGFNLMLSGSSLLQTRCHVASRECDCKSSSTARRCGETEGTHDCTRAAGVHADDRRQRKSREPVCHME